MMTSDGALGGLTRYKFFSTENIYRDQQALSRRPAVWNSRTVPLGEVLRCHTTPVVVRDVERRIDHQRRDVYVHSVSASSVVLADGLTFDPRCGLVSTGRRYLIPVEHGGWFELLSQDGHAAAPITSVQQLIKLAPQRCLVRRTIVAASGDGAGRQPCKVGAGEVLVIEGVVAGGPASHHSQCLRCRVVSTGQCILLAADQRGVFSPVAGPTNVAGVHRMHSLVEKFRLPVVVRLITRNSSATEPPSSSSNNSASATPSVTFRVLGIQTEPTAYIVPLWLIKVPSDVGRRSLFSLPATAQASSVLDGFSTSSDASSALTEIWTEADWNELDRRCEELIQSRAVTVELTRTFPAHGVDDSQRNVPVTSPAEPSQPSENERRLLREIDHIYDAIKAVDATAHKNGVVRAATTRQIPRRYRSVRQDPAVLAAFNSGEMKPRTQARRSNTLDPSYGKPAHHHSSLELFHNHHAQQQHPDNNNPRRMMSSSVPVRLGRMTAHATPPSGRRQSPPQLQLQQQLQHTEPVYEELKSPALVNSAAKETVENGQYVVLADSSIKHDPTTTSYKQSHHPTTSVERSRRWSVAAGPGQSGAVVRQLQVFEDLTSTNNDGVGVGVPAIPPTLRPDSAAAHVDAVPRSVSSGRLTSSSSDDVTATDRNLSSGRGTVSNTLKRALCRQVSAAAADGPRLSSAAALSRPPSRPADHVPVTSRPYDVIEYAVGGRVTHF